MEIETSYVAHISEHDDAGHAVNHVYPVRRTGYVYDARMKAHSTLAEEEHPEKPDRISSIFQTLVAHACIPRMHQIYSREATRAEIELIHDSALWDQYEANMTLPLAQLKTLSHDLELSSSLYLNHASTFCARLSCGSVVEMCSAVASGRVQNGFAIVRPPGHHAEPGAGFGFCLYNNVAVSTRVLLDRPLGAPDRVERVMILDWDVHHGNGTQRAFWDNKQVLYISLHRYENGTFYPGTSFGNYDQVGGESARGTSVNVPWPCSGMDDGDYLHAFQHCIMPIAYEFAPDLVIVSAGFDAAQDDMLGGCLVSPAGYAHMTHQLMALAQGNLVVALEGGYTLDAISRSALAVVRTLLGDPLPPLPRGTACSLAAADTVRRVIRAQAPYWVSLRTALEYGPSAVPTSLTASTLNAATTDVVHGAALTHVTDSTTDAAAAQISTTPSAASVACIPTPELLLDARAARLWKRHQLLPIPTHAGLQRNQALCSSSLMLPTTQTLVIFVHDLANLHKDVQGAPYVADSADALVQWAMERNYALMDLCTMVPLPLQTVRNHSHGKALAYPDDPTPSALNEQIQHIWDVYCAISPVTKVFLVGLGTGCEVLMHLITTRAIQSRVHGMVQVMGMNSIPLVPKAQRELKSWYLKHARVICPPTHPYFAWNEQASSGKRLGTVQRSHSPCPMETLVQCLPNIDSMLSTSS